MPAKSCPTSRSQHRRSTAVQLPFSFSAAAPIAALNIPADTVMVRQPSQQVFLILQYHFGACDLGFQRRHAGSFRAKHSPLYKGLTFGRGLKIEWNARRRRRPGQKASAAT